MAEPRKVPFVTLSAFTAAAAAAAAAAAPAPGSEARKRRLDADTKPNGSRETGLGAPEATGSNKSPGLGETVRINIRLAQSTEQSFSEFSYSDLLQAQKNPPAVPPTSRALDDEQRHKQEVEALARKFEDRYGSVCRSKRADRVQDLVDIGFGYDETDSFIDNSEAYDELVPASLTTKLGGFYINTGTLQFRNASDSESNDVEKPDTDRGGEESEVKKRRRKDEAEPEEKMTNNQPTTPGVCRPEKKRRKLMLASMMKRFTQEKKETCRPNMTNSVPPLHTDALLGDLTSDPAMMSLLTSANESELQDLLNKLGFGALDPDPQMRNGLTYAGAGLGAVDGACVNRGAELACPPPLPEGLPASLVKRIEDLRAASRQFDEEGRKKFFTLDMNNILLDIELQVQEQSPSVRGAVYSHLEAFVPCNKEALLKRLKKLSLNIQDDRLRTPLLNLKLAVCSAMREQMDRYNRDCMAKVAAKQQMEDGERNGSEDEEEEKPGKRVIGPRKKFIWDDNLRTLLCNLVRVKLRCYEQEKSSLSVEDYLKAFMETEVKPLWPKGWMQARMLFKESHTVHGHLTDLVKKKILTTPKPPKIKELGWQLGPVPGLSPAPFSSHPPPETICLSDSLDEDLATNFLDSNALTLLNNSTNGVNPDSAPCTSSPSPVVAKPHPHTASPTPSAQSTMFKDVSLVQRQTDTPASKASNTSTAYTPAAKPRPPPTTTPLQKPFGAIGIKPGQAPPPAAQIKNSSHKLCDGVVQQSILNSLNPKSFQQLTTPPSPLLPLIQKKATPTGHQQRFITPMQATITKSSQSSNSPIIKLTHRPPAQTTPSGSSQRPPAQTMPSGSSQRPPAQTTPSGSSQRSPAQTTPSGSSQRSPAQTTPSAHRLSAQTTPSAFAQRISAQTTATGPAHCPSALTTASGPAHRPSAQTTPSGPANRSPAQTTPSGSAHRPLAQPTPSAPSQRSNALTTPSGSAHRPPAQPTPSAPSQRANSQTTPSATSQRSNSQTTPSGSAHRPSAQTILSAPAHRPSAQTTPFGPSHRPSQTKPSGPSHRPPAQTTPSGSVQHLSAQTTPSGSSHRPSAQATTPGFTQRSPVQTVPSSATHHPTAQTTPPVSAQRALIQSTVHVQPIAQLVLSGSAHRSSVSTPSPPSTAHHPTITTSSSGQSNRSPASNSLNIGPAHRSTASTLPASGSSHRPSASTPPSPSSQRSSVQTPPSSAYRPSVPTPPPNLAHRSPVATPPSVSSPASTPPTQYKPKSSGFKPPFSPAPVATPHTSSFQDCNLTSSSVTTNHGQRQRAVGGANQSNMSSANCASAMGLPSLSDSVLLNQVSSVPLGLGMFGGLVPVSLPFQLPLLNFAPPGAATHTPSSGYTLTPNMFKSLQSGVAAALPPHLQLAFSESNQSQGEDVKRK